MAFCITTKQDLHKFRDALHKACDRFGIRLGKSNSHANAIAALLIGSEDYNRALASLPNEQIRTPEFKSHRLTEDDCTDLSLTVEKPQMFCVSLLKDQKPRTLLYGYTVDNDTVHIYLDDGLIHAMVYKKPAKFMLSYHKGDKILASLLRPTKRAYPALCDFEFCKILNTLLEHKISFTTFDGEDSRRNRDFVCYKASEISPIDPNCG